MRADAWTAATFDLRWCRGGNARPWLRWQSSACGVRRWERRCLVRVAATPAAPIRVATLKEQAPLLPSPRAAPASSPSCSTSTPMRPPTRPASSRRQTLRATRTRTAPGNFTRACGCVVPAAYGVNTANTVGGCIPPPCTLFKIAPRPVTRRRTARSSEIRRTSRSHVSAISA